MSYIFWIVMFLSNTAGVVHAIPSEVGDFIAATVAANDVTPNVPSRKIG